MPLTEQASGTRCGHLGAAAVLLALVCGASSPAEAQAQAAPLPAADGFRAAALLALDTTGADQGKKKKKDNWGFRLTDDHPTLRLGMVRIAIRARLQQDKVTSEAVINNTPDSTDDVARRRLGVEGEIVKYADFHLEREFGNVNDRWPDASVNYKQFDFAQFEVGKFKEPFSVDENTGATSLDFVKRSLAASTLAPGRDVGYMFHGRALYKTIRYEYGSFEHDGSNAMPHSSDRVFGGTTHVWRLSTEPFHWSKSFAQDFEVGLAQATTTIPEGFSEVRGQTVFSDKFFKSDYYVLGARKRTGLEMRWRPGPFLVQWEHITFSDERLGESVEDTDLNPITARGWYLMGSWAITGEKKADGLDNTKHDVLHHGIGAVEVAARIERLTFDSADTGDLPSDSPRATVVTPNSDKVFTFGVNWYPQRWFKIQFNWIKETLTDPTLGPLPDQPSFTSRILRFQFSL